MDIDDRIEDLLVSELSDFYENKKDIQNILSRIPDKHSKRKLLEFIKTMEVRRTSEIESMICLINKEKTDIDKKIISELFAIYNSADFVLGAFLPLVDEKKIAVMKFIDENQNISKDELKEKLMSMIIGFVNERKGR